MKGKNRTFTFNEEQIKDAIEFALDDTVLMWRDFVRDITPRDPMRPPKNPNAKVTGNLKRSISSEKLWRFEHVIGTIQGEGEYGWFQEFWTRYMAPRSFVRLWLIEWEDKLVSNFAKVTRQRLASFLN
jgi:hypothetical protein